MEPSSSVMAVMFGALSRWKSGGWITCRRRSEMKKGNAGANVSKASTPNIGVPTRLWQDATARAPEEVLLVCFAGLRNCRPHADLRRGLS